MTLKLTFKVKSSNGIALSVKLGFICKPSMGVVCLWQKCHQNFLGLILRFGMLTYTNIPKQKRVFLACQEFQVFVWSCNKICPVKIFILNETAICLVIKELYVNTLLPNFTQKNMQTL